MTIAITIDAIPYLIQSAKEGESIARSRVVTLHGRPKAEALVGKLLTQNPDKTEQIKSLFDSSSSTMFSLESALVDALCARSHLILRDATASGGSASRPATASASAEVPKATDRIDGSTLLSTAMKTYLKESQITSMGVSSVSMDAATPSASSPVISKSEELPPKDNSFELIIEIAGQHLLKKQGLQVKTAQGKIFKKYANNVHKSQHRSECRFNDLENEPCKLGLTIPFKGVSQPVVLPLHDALPVYKKGTEKKLWDTVLVPVKPLQFLTPAQEKQQADILQNGWLYVFWKGRLWREIKVSKHGVLQDVNLDFYRASKNVERKAEGHWLDAIWVPYIINGSVQKDVVLAASAVQWSWGTIEAFESNSTVFSNQTASLDAMVDYQASKAFDDVPSQSGSIEKVSTTENTHQTVIERQKRQKIAVAYLPKVAAKIKVQLKDDLGNPLSNIDFELSVGDQLIQAKTDAQGYLEANIPKDLKHSDLHFYNKSPNATLEHFSIKLSETEPVSTVKGLQLRLNNLGFDAGPVDGVSGRKTKSATRAFQSKHHLMVDGISGPQTQSALAQEHQS